ncbi:MAG: LLM class F420-dependent oxidoreductase [Acidimicrobiia bacterium]|nr:LLM class F420-dependent oxidoreductase [Acidimicrobiia bacterium]
MKLSVDFPSVAFREGPEKVLALGAAIEQAGYDEIAVFDHVVMGYETETRDRPIYPPQMPILEAIVLLAQLAVVTETVGLATEVLVLPQRQPTLVAKQVSTLDTLSGGRVRLGIGVGWQESEYEALGEDFSNRGRRMDEAIRLLRSYWGDDRIDFDGDHYTATAMAMEPKPPQGWDLPLWIGGGSTAALHRVAELGDGWMGTAVASDEQATAMVATIHDRARAIGRDPAEIGLQMMLQPPPRSTGDKAFYADHDQVVARATTIAEMGYDWASLNATAIFQAGARSVDAMIDQLASIHGKIRAAVG